MAAQINGDHFSRTPGIDIKDVDELYKNSKN